MPPLLVIGFFIAVSFAGLWLELGPIWRMVGTGLFALAFVIALVPLFGLGTPSRQEALARIDRESGVAHRPASTLDDALANASDDPTTQALWSLHRQRMARNVSSLRPGLPSPRMVDFDRYALRAFVLIALIASAFVAGPEKNARLASAFDWRGITAGDGAGYRVDAWIDPPPYTGKAPVLLKLANADSAHPEKILVPIGSTVIVRSSGGDLGLDVTGALEKPKPKKSAPPAKDQAAKQDAAATTPPAQKSAATTDPNEHRLILRGDARLGIRHSGALLGLFDLVVIPDKPPRIELTDAPRPNLRGSLTLSYKIEDDYGVVSAAAEFSDPTVEGAKGKLRSLVPPPRVGLALPPGPGGLGETEATLDLSDHPWAGARVKLVLTTTDEAGNEGRSDPIYITLPEKQFTKPLAKALVEQRRNLVLYPDNKDLVELALQSLMLAPEAFGTTMGVYLGLDVANHMLLDAKSDKDLVATADFLWEMAQQIENGDLSQAERDLRAAEQALREALQRGASDEEIRKLTENLRAAMNKFLSEFAKQQGRQRNAQQMPSQNGAKAISPKDLQKMLDRLQQMARAGDRTSAQQLLEQLQNTLDNLEMAQRQQGDEAGQEMSRALSDLDKLMREQQSLRDKTHRQGQAQQQQQDEQQQGQSQPGDQDNGEMGFGQGQQQGQGQFGQQGQGQQAQQGQGQDQQGANEALRQQQQALRQRLEELQKRLRQRGQGGEGLADARRAMQDAERSLSQGGQNGNGAAVDAQGRALEAMRRGADQLAQQMQGQGEGQGNGAAQGEQQGGTDPLGRQMGDSAFNPNSRYDPLGLPAAQRAQRVLEELRRRLSDPSRAREEMDYLERLLHGY